MDETLRSQFSWGRTATIEIPVHREYGFSFEKHNDNWAAQAEYNLLFVHTHVRHMSQILNSRGHLFLNEALVMLGFDPIPAGQVVGWTFENGALDIIVEIQSVDALWISCKPHGVIVNNI